MESNIEEASKAKENAEKRFAVKDYVGARNFAVKARKLFPELDGITQMISTFGIYVASETKINGEVDFYSVLGLKPSADRSMVKRRYKKLAVLLHPDKNKTVGANGAFKLVSEAWMLLSDAAKRSSYDLKRNGGISAIVPPTFWTVCTSCQVQYEYLRKYINKRLTCQNCRAAFMALELRTAPISSSYPVCPWSSSSSYASDNGRGISNMPSNWGSHTGTSAGYVDQNGYTSLSGQTSYPSNGYVSKPGKEVKEETSINVNGSFSCNGTAAVKVTRPYKKRKAELGVEVSAYGNDYGRRVFQDEGIFRNGSSAVAPMTPTVDSRSLLIQKARTSIVKKLEEWKEERRVAVSVIAKSGGPRRRANCGVSDFHDFDKERAQECLKPKQIWALYDEEDGMPRFYCLIREVISLNPFKVHISYLSSKSDTEFGMVNWIQFGFTKSCGNFRAYNSTDVVEDSSMFSHLLSREKAGRGGFIRIFPRTGDIWALYKNWSPEWNRLTPFEVRHQYEMVEVLDDCSEELGVHVMPLIKLDGFKTVYSRNTDKNAVQWIPRREMLKFSHQVPSRLLIEEKGLPEGCWDLDPAAITMEETTSEGKSNEANT